ncbi:hypothetical protein KAFR_0E01380 [Kazachstania africana CBS 2517]|uniref:sphinganine-1-phosphate aldolase n=1 Tax=Kazachstania africana (strain ATCC 22294 / BCRC 22015 / CBS 2517 / CECT 1963 / NBRC 1671 / NRRL Y-8276) TaxID=1071382 RepID=H2AV92_KAZAF|nr:hypothetical protein KAFR_0E01380 [Kazachstania africana CBS 2517]CCF58292.1 hypothetical protein KAFR_0E01380 [Kazachstania africana CBS 2517]
MSLSCESWSNKIDWDRFCSLDVNLAAHLLWNRLITYFKVTPWYQIVKDYLFLILCYKIVSDLIFNVKCYGPMGYVKRLVHLWIKKTINWLLKSPLLREKVEKQVNDALVSIENDLIKTDPRLPDYVSLPEKGVSQDMVLEQLDQLQTALPHTKWEDGKVSGAVYHGGSKLINLQSQAFEKYCVANQLHPDVFPAVRKMESEVVSMILKMFNAPEGACGTTTSGGTESLLLASLSAKMYGLRHKGIKNPEMIAPITAHAGFDKASYYFGIKMHHVPLNPITFKVDLKRVEKFINKNTVMLCGSVPNFPHGIDDDIVGLGKIAQKHNIPLHVDCCLGSFVVAFAEKAGFTDMPVFDFRVPGVTSISCDTHKYGFAPKGSSVLMYRNEVLRSEQYYINPDWVGGLYGSSTLAGSRPGALVVGCWATMINIGEDGYMKSCRDLINAARKLKNFIETHLSPTLRIIGDPKFSVVAFTSDVIDVYELSDRLAKNGWHLSTLQKPAALHLAVTRLSIDAIDELCELLSRSVNDLLKDPNARPSSTGTSAVYGVAGSVKTTGVADRLIVGFLDSLYKLKPRPNKN